MLMKNTLPFLTLALLLLASASRVAGPRAAEVAPAKDAKIIVREDVVYGRVEGAGLLADIAYPEGTGPFPVILSVHGGRWFRESKSTASAIKVRQWAGFGFFAMSIDYRLVGCTPAPACYQDLLCAIRWTHAHADKYPIDRKRIYLIGQSAGGHLVSLAATLGDGPFPRTGGWDDQPHDFRGVLSIAAPYELTRLDWGSKWSPAGADPIAARKLASPINHVHGKMKPMLIMHSDNDKSVPIMQVLDMVDALQKAKVEHHFVRYKDKGHMSINEDVIKEARAFIEKTGGTRPKNK
jgi:acetyl esterase/lipase